MQNNVTASMYENVVELIIHELFGISELYGTNFMCVFGQ